MTNKEAIRILGLECDEWDISHCTASERREAFEMAITALQELENARKDTKTHENTRKRTNNSTDGVKNVNDNSNNSINSKVKGMTACRVPEDDTISRRQAIDIFDDYNVSVENGELEAYSRDRKRLCDLPSVQQERLTDDDFETIRIHLNAHKEKLCNQKRWKEAEEYQRIIDRFMAFASAQPEEAIPVAWLEEQAKWFESMDNAFAKIEANNIRVTIKRWRRGNE